MTISITRTNFNDFEALQDLLQDSRADIVQLGNGRMHGTITHLALDDLGISTGFFSTGMRSCGVASAKRWTIGMMLESAGPVSSVGHSIAAGDLSIFAPGEERYTSALAGSRYLAAFISPETLQATLAPSPGALEILERNRAGTVITDRGTTEATVRQLTPLLASLTERKITPEIAELSKRRILELLLAPLHNASHYRGHPSRSNLIREIEHYLFTVESIRQIHIPDLCKRFNVHRRTLHRAFMEALGIPPMRYLHQRQLNAVHRELLRGGHGTKVHDVAIKHGFLELGRFAAAYKRQFGELPKHTLRRSLHIVATMAFIMFAGSMTYAYDDCDDDDYFIPPRHVMVHPRAGLPQRQ